MPPTANNHWHLGQGRIGVLLAQGHHYFFEHFNT